MISQFYKYSEHSTTSEDESKFQAKIKGEDIIRSMGEDLYETLHALRNCYVKGWDVFPEVVPHVLEIRGQEYGTLVRDILRLSLKEQRLREYVTEDVFRQFEHFGLLLDVSILLGVGSLGFLLKQKNDAVICRLIETQPIEFNFNAIVFNEFCAYLMMNEAIFEEVRELSIDNKNYRLYGICQLILFHTDNYIPITRKTISSTGLLCNEWIFYEKYEEIAKYWEKKYDFEPVIRPSVIFSEEFAYQEFEKTYCSMLFGAPLSEFELLMERLYEQLTNYQPIDYTDVYNQITEYSMILISTQFDQELLAIIAQLILFLIEETYQQNDQEIKFRDEEKQYEVIYLLESEYEYFSYSKEELILPDYYEVMQIRANDEQKLTYEEQLNKNVELLNGKLIDFTLCKKDPTAYGFTPVESRSAHPNQLFKIPADTHYLELLSAFAKLILVNGNGKQILDEINLSVSMLRFLIISIFENDSYNVRSRATHHGVTPSYCEIPESPKFVCYPTANCAEIRNSINNVLYISQTYPLVLQNFKTMQTPYPIVHQYNIQEISSSSPYYKLQGLYEAPALSLYQFCFPIEKKVQFQNMFGIFKSSPSLNMFIFEPSITIFLYNIVQQVPDSAANEHSRMIVDTITEGIHDYPFLCKHESILLCLSSFLISYDIISALKIHSLKIHRFICIFLSNVPLLELAYLLYNQNHDLSDNIRSECQMMELKWQNDHVLDQEFGNYYQGDQRAMHSIEKLYSFFLKIIGEYIDEIVLNTQELDICILTNILFMFHRQADKSQIAHIISKSAGLFTGLEKKLLFEDKTELFSKRKQQLQYYLQSIQIFYNQYKIADPRVFSFDVYSLFASEIRDFYYYQRIFKAEDQHLLRCFQGQIRHYQNQLEKFYPGVGVQAQPEEQSQRYYSDVIDRFASSLLSNQAEITISRDYYFAYLLQECGYFKK